MYHVIAAPPPGAPFPGLYVEPQLFAAQMQALKQAGWHAVTQDQLEAYWRRGVPLGPGKPIVLTFDNGYQSQYTQALPVLRRLGWVAVENIQLSGLPPSQGGLLQRQIRGLVAAGWELDTQGFSHADLVTLDAAALHYQVAVARETIRRRYGVPVNWFCYPSGHYDASVIAEVKAAGYAGSTTVVPGWAHRERRPVPAATAAGARRHEPPGAALGDRGDPRRSAAAGLLHRRLSDPWNPRRQRLRRARRPPRSGRPGAGAAGLNGGVCGYSAGVAAPPVPVGGRNQSTGVRQWTATRSRSAHTRSPTGTCS